MNIKKKDNMTATKPKKAATMRPTPWILRLPEIFVSPSTKSIGQALLSLKAGACKTDLAPLFNATGGVIGEMTNGG